MSDWQKIQAKFKSPCLSCRGIIQKGETVIWKPKAGVRHLKCPDRPTTSRPGFRETGVNYDTPCLVCEKPVRKNDMCMWVPGSGVMHNDCVGDLK